MITLDLNDAGLLAARRSDGALVALEDGALSSPGAALPAAGGLVTGLAAWRQARLHPTRVILDAWDRLDVQPLNRADVPARHAADVALAHARALQTRLGLAFQPVLLITPAHYTRDQLGVLLGIAQSLKLNLAGLVDAGTAVIARPPESEHALFLDLQLTRASASLYAHRDGVLKRLGTASTAKAGLWQSHQALLKGVAKQFVLQTRFDPAHDAASEQALFDQLPDVLARLAGKEAAEVQLAQGGQIQRAAVKSAVLAQALAPAAHEWLAMIQDLLHRHGAAGLPLEIHAGHRLAHLPGLAASLHTLGDVRVVWAPEGAAARGAFDLAGGAALDGARLVTTRSFAAPAPVPAAAPAPAAGPDSADPSGRPTHLLLGDIAHPVNGLTWNLAPDAGKGTITLSREANGAGVSLRGDDDGVLLHSRDARARLNGRPAAGIEDLGLGDRIGFDGIPREARLIRAVGGGA